MIMKKKRYAMMSATRKDIVKFATQIPFYEMDKAL